MPITYDGVRKAARDLYGWSLKKVPDDTLLALARAREQESNADSRKTLDFMLAAARAAEQQDRHACSDAGFPTYFVKLGTRLTIDGDIRRAGDDVPHQRALATITIAAAPEDDNQAFFCQRP